MQVTFTMAPFTRKVDVTMQLARPGMSMLREIKKGLDSFGADPRCIVLPLFQKQLWCSAGLPQWSRAGTWRGLSGFKLEICHSIAVWSRPRYIIFLSLQNSHHKDSCILVLLTGIYKLVQVKSKVHVGAMSVLAVCIP